MTAVYPYATQATGWSSWAESLLTEASALTPATLLAGQSGGVLDDHISELTAMKNAAERISDSAYTTAKVAGVQDQFDRALAAAPSEGEVKEAEHAAERVRLQQKYAQPRQGDQAIINRAGFLREDRDAAIKQHARDTATTQWPSVPESGYTASPTAPSGPPNTYGPNGIGTDGEPPWGTEDKETPAGTRLSSANTPNASTGVPLMTAAQAPQPTATSAPTNTTPGITPTAAWTPPATKPKSTIGDKDGVRERPGRETPETTPGTSPSADRGSVIHGVTKGDVSGAGQNMLGQTARIGDSTVASNQGRMGGTGMMPGMMGMMPGMMGGLGGQPSGRGRSGDRPEVLTSDPNLLGTVDDENSFDGGLIGSGDPRFDDVLFGPTRAEIEARENPHLVSRR